jgi:protein-L-isoaspartate(D-aspartate) O-methyltransferase
LEGKITIVRSGDLPHDKPARPVERLIFGLRTTQAALETGAGGRTFCLRWMLRDRSESPATTACIEAAGAGLAGSSRGFSRPAPIEIWSSKIAKLARMSKPVIRRVLALTALFSLAACRSRPEPPAPASTAAGPARGADAAPSGQNERQAELDALVSDISREAEIGDERVVAAVRRVARHRFVPESVTEAAYEDRPLPIGHGQTISQPTVVAVMTASVAPKKTDRCLEIGTGSGYQAAILAELCQKVWSIEYVPELARFAETNLRAAGYGPDRVALRAGDGYRGWPEFAPFEVIVVTAAPEKVPAPLLEQLALGGRLVIPVGREHETQRLELYRRTAPGNSPGAFETKMLMAVRFVPFVGEAREKR